MNISLATSDQERTLVYRFRYSIYVDEMNRPQRYANHDLQQIVDPLDEFGHVLVARDRRGKVVGTLRTNFLRDGGVGEYALLYRLADSSPYETQVTSITTRLMIAPEYRSGTLAVKLAIAVYDLGLAHGIEADYIDCNSPLDRFFTRLGHKLIHRVEHPEYGVVNVMKLELRDIPHLKQIGSPFIRLRRA